MNPVTYQFAPAFAVALAAALLTAAATKLLQGGSRRYATRLSRLSGVEFAELYIFPDPTRFALWNAAALLFMPCTAFFLTACAMAQHF